MVVNQFISNMVAVSRQIFKGILITLTVVFISWLVKKESVVSHIIIFVIAFNPFSIKSRVNTLKNKSYQVKLLKKKKKIEYPIK